MATSGTLMGFKYMESLSQIAKVSAAVCRMLGVLSTFAMLTMALLPTPQAAASSSSNTNVVYQGRIIKPDGSPLQESNVQFTLQVYGNSSLLGNGTSGTDRCLLYQETQTVDMSSSGGAFQLYLGQGTSPTFGSGVSSLVTVFRNPQNNSPAASEAIGAINCSSGQTKYLSSTWDNNRELSVTVTTSEATLNLSAMQIQAVPYAQQALQLGGYSSDYLMRVQSSRPGTANNFSANQFDFLLNLGINAVTPGSPSTYQVSNLLANDPTAAHQVATKNYVDNAVAGVSGSLPTLSSATIWVGNSSNAATAVSINGDASMDNTGKVTVTALQTKPVSNTAPTSNQVLQFNGSAWVPATIVTAVTGSSLSDGKFWLGNSGNTAQAVSMTGDIVMNDSGVTTYSGIVPITKGGTGVSSYTLGQIPVYDGTKLTGLGCSLGQVLQWQTGTGFACATISGVSPAGSTLASAQIWVGNSSSVATAVSVSGDVSLSNSGGMTVTQIQGRAVASTAPTSNQILQFNGSAWVPTTANYQSSTLSSSQFWVGNSSNVATAVTMSGDATMTNSGAVTNTGLQGKPVSSTAPSSSGQVLMWNGASWGPSSSTSATGSGTQNYVTKWSNASGGLTNSLIYDNGTSVGVNTSSPWLTFSVAGNLGASGKVAIFPTGTTPGTIPGQPLSVVANTAATQGYNTNGAVYLAPWSSGNDVSFDFGNWNGSSYITRMAISNPQDGTSGNRLGFGTATTELMSFTAAGLLGLGTTTPSGTLHILATGDTSASGTPPLIIQHNGTAATNYASITFKTDSGLNSGIWKNSSGQTGYAGASSLNIGTNSTENVGIATNNITRMTFLSGGAIGINTTAPDSATKLDVAGSIRAANNTDNGTSAVDFSTGNTQFTSSSCGAYTLKNLRPGGNYTFIVQGTTAATCSFTMYSDSGTTALTSQKYVPANGNTINGKSTVYNIQVIGTVAYVNWVPGF